MAFLSELIFRATAIPDEKIIEWLVNCITLESGTRQFNIFNTAEALDPTPVFRSFIFKLLLQCQAQETAINCLKKVLTDWSGGDEEKLGTMILLMECEKVLFFLCCVICFVFKKKNIKKAQQ